MKASRNKSILGLAAWLVLASVLYPSSSEACEPIVSGQTKYTKIEFGGEAHCYWFWAEAGQGVVIGMGDNSKGGVLEPRIQLYDPRGVRIRDSWHHSQATIENCQLAVTGIYTMVASDAGGDVDTGEYALSLVVAPGDTTSLCEWIVSGETKSATILFGGEIHGYSFWAEAGQGVVIESGDNSEGGILEPRIQLYDPRGVRIKDSWDYSQATIDNCPLTKTGIYTIVASDADEYREVAPDTGNYGVSLVVTGGTTTCLQDRDGGDMTAGRAVNGTVAPGGDLEAYTFYGEVGQGIDVQVTDRSALGHLEPRVRLCDPNGRQVADSWDYARASITDYQLKMSGFYTIVVSDKVEYREVSTDTGEYGISVAVMPPKDPHGLYPYGPRPGDGESISFCDPNYQVGDVLVENKKLPSGSVVKRVSGAYLLSWWSVVGATGYDVYFAASPCLPLEKIAENIPDAWTPMPAVEGGQVCHWRVVAHTPSGDIKGPTWWFAAKACPFSLTISTVGRGSIVDPNAGVHSYPQGQVVSVTAKADPEFEFVRWEGSAVDANKAVREYQDAAGSKVWVTVDGAYTLKAVFEEVICDFPLDDDPGWTRQGQWEFGKPTGQGGEEHGNPDPTGGYTGQNVFGVHLNGDYDTTVGGPYWLVGGPFDLSGYQDVQLRFWRWLNTDCADYVKSSLEVSRDRKTWNPVWQNPQDAEVADAAWTLVEEEIGSWADGQPNVYVRWSYQIVKERAYPYSGWNLDDIQLIGRSRK
ncbi:MAG: hypothetical protein FJ280_17880 [Planctomycetes bacterium]|nr:hypothetical protein [Planctomycetota bacterium]